MEKIIILLGPTGVGKTSTSLLLAKLLKTEIISSDSMQIYKHMDIGTAKPSAKERDHIKHHMIDIVEPWESYSAGQYIRDVQPIIDNLLDKNKTPLIVGGTGLYIKAMTRGIFKGHSADWNLRNELLKKEEIKKGFLYEYLESIDSRAASKIMPNDKRRIIRALEVCLKSNKTMSELHQLTHPLPYKFIKTGITRDRAELYRIIEQRVDKMIADGLVKEVKSVVELIEKRGSRKNGKRCEGVENCRIPISSPLHIEDFTAMQAIGYKEIALYLSEEVSLEEAVRLIKRRTKMYAKRQFTWFKKEEGVQWVDVTGIYDPYKILHKVIQFIHY